MADVGTRIPRCTGRKHVVENGQPACDCQAIILWPTAEKNALVVTLPPGVIFDRRAIEALVEARRGN